MDKQETRWSIWLPVAFSVVGAIVFFILLIASKADASDVASQAARLMRVEVHFKYLSNLVYLMAQHQGLNVPPPPDL